MESIENLRGRRVYLDTNIFIYAVEAVAEYAAAVDALFDLIEAARLQAALTLRPPDAIHVATAAAAGCSALLSNDQRIKVPTGLALVRFA